ncbi:MAG: hypothetical protein UY32_C0008G0026, partial [Candidatus Jorgensenbacteria bacterium GW2011_GWC1_48_8]
RVPRRIPLKKPVYIKLIGWSLISLVLVFGVISVLALFNLKEVKTVVLQKSGLVISNFVSSLNFLKDLKPGEASSALAENSRELSGLNALIGKPGTKTVLAVLGGVVPALKNAGGFLNNVTALNLNFLELSEALYDLELYGFHYFQNDGRKLLQKFVEVKNIVSNTSHEIESARNSASSLKSVSPFFADAEAMIGGEYLKYSADLRNLERFMEGLTVLFGAPEEKHILLLFQNPAEIRPAGGFLGSYGDLTVKEGQMVNLQVQDIYWPDHPMNFNLKLIPPEPLQAVTKDWGARDGNWFFDFPTSARTVASILESSKIYKDQNVIFDAVFALNIRVMETLLRVLGPIDIPDYNLKISADNFLMEIQREVEIGRDKKPGENPKKILSVITPIILEKLGSISETERVALADAVKAHFEKKDIMIYAKEANLASFFKSIGLDGSVFELPNNFWGTYLAVVNSNIAGGKSDAFIKETAEVRIDIDIDGGVFTDLELTRKHEGNTQKDPWWRATNQNYLQVFANPGSTLVSLKGNDVKKFGKPVYDKTYETNADLEKIESTKVTLSGYDAWSMEAFGKNVFATWFNVPSGKSRTLSLSYQTPRPGNFVLGEGSQFRFIFERQSGVQNDLRVTVSAPIGYHWVESGSPAFVYEDNDPDARTIVDLTLAKND